MKRLVPENNTRLDLKPKMGMTSLEIKQEKKASNYRGIIVKTRIKKNKTTLAGTSQTQNMKACQLSCNLGKTVTN
jgi:hypothetical protein